MNLALGIIRQICPWRLKSLTCAAYIAKISKTPKVYIGFFPGSSVYHFHAHLKITGSLCCFLFPAHNWKGKGDFFFRLCVGKDLNNREKKFPLPFQSRPLDGVAK